MYICSTHFIFLGRGGLEDERALDKQQSRGRVQEWMVREEDEGVLEDGGPDEGGEDPCACLCQDSCRVSVAVAFVSLYVFYLLTGACDEVVLQSLIWSLSGISWTS